MPGRLGRPHQVRIIDHKLDASTLTVTLAPFAPSRRLLCSPPSYPPARQLAHCRLSVLIDYTRYRANYARTVKLLFNTHRGGEQINGRTGNNTNGELSGNEHKKIIQKHKQSQKEVFRKLHVFRRKISIASKISSACIRKICS